MQHPAPYRPFKHALQWTRFAALLMLLLWASNASGQTYPAQVNVNIQPPYSPYLTDFLVQGQERMLVTINFLDLSEPSWDAKIRLRIEGNGLQLVTSAPFYQPLTLTPGPNVVGPEVLVPLIDFSKMDVQGTNKNDLVNAGRLPEGTYQFCVEVVDAGREVPLALPGCFTATLIQNNPPQLTTPECGATISASGGQSVQFNWIPQHDPSILVRYEIKIVQVPNGMNVNDAINATSTPILDWFQVNGTSFVYGPDQLPLEMNGKYAFQIRVVDQLGLTTFENDGKAPVCWFVYGFSTGGTIDLTAPAFEARVEDPEKVDFAWQGPSNALPGQQIKYHLKVVKLGENEQLGNPTNAQAIIDRTDGVWYNDSTDIAPNIFGSMLSVEQALEPGARYAWQVQASTEGIKVAKSEVWWFEAPPVVFAFWCASGEYMVTVTDISNYTKVSETKFTNLTGEGTVVLAQGEAPTEVSYQNLTLELVANKWVLKIGEVIVPRDEDLELDFGDYGDGSFAVNAWVLTSMEFLAQGQVIWSYPLSVNAPGNATVVSAENARLNYLNKVLAGAVPFAENQSYDLLIPMGFKVKYKQGSQFIVQSGGTATFKLYGEAYFPGSLKTVSGSPFYVPFEDQTNPWYMTILRMTPRDNLALFDKTSMSLQPKSFVIDFSGNESPGIHSGTPEWVGVYMTEYNIFVPQDFDEKGQLKVNEDLVFTYVTTSPGYQPSWIGAGGLNLDLNTTFTDTALADPDFATINTFAAKIKNLRLKITDNSLSNSFLDGYLRSNFLGKDNRIAWVTPIAANGIQTGYFDETKVVGFEREFMKDDPEANVTFKINQAVFEGGDHMRLNVSINWPSMQANLQNIGNFHLYGNGDIGFKEPGGSVELQQQVPVTVGRFAGMATELGAFYENYNYGFSVVTQAALPGGMVAPAGIPVKVSVSNSTGEAPLPVAYVRVDGAEVTSKKRVGPFKVEMDNSLIRVDMFMDYVDDDKTFGSRFEAKGALKLKQPDPLVAVARLVAGETSDGTGFWYIRAAAQGTNTVMKDEKGVPIGWNRNGFDFRIYHHLTKPQGSALVQPNQFNDFWNIDPAEANNSIDGHVLDGSVFLGMYGKLGIHDTYSGQRQKGGGVNITEEIPLPSLGDILPELPSLCDLEIDGKSICKYFNWPWEGWDMCDFYVPKVENNVVTKQRWCDVGLFDLNWSTLDVCNLMTSSGKKIGDFTIGELGLDQVDLCDVKLPGGMGLCEIFELDGAAFCDIKDANGPLCEKKLCDLMPELPPVCEWKIPGVQQLCDFDLGDILPDVDICAYKGPDGKSLFCSWRWPDILPDIPNPCDLKLPNGQKLCEFNANWCDIQVPTFNNGVPVIQNGLPVTKSLCEVGWFEFDWTIVNPCDWKINGTPLCSINLNFCDLNNPITDEPICDILPDFCDLEEPITGKSICEIGLWDMNWSMFNLCDLKWPGTDRKLCDLNIKLCELYDPRVSEPPFFCNLKWPDLIPDFPNVCEIIPMPQVYPNKSLCNFWPEFNIPNFCDLELVNNLALCEIKPPDLGIDIPNIPIPPLPGIPGMPENMYMVLFMGGLRVEIENSGGVRQVAIDGNAWFYTYRLDPNDSYLARAFGGMEIWPAQQKVQFHMEGESGSIKTDLGRIKPICGTGTINGEFTPEDWYVDVGTKKSPWEIELGCMDILSCSGYISMRPSGLLAHGEINKHAETNGGFDIGVADIDFWAKAHLDIAMEMGISFSDPAIFGSVEADAGASAGVTVDPDTGEDWDIEFANVNMGGRLSFKVDESICVSGNLYGSVRILGQGVELTVGCQIKNGAVSFPENPAKCY